MSIDAMFQSFAKELDVHHDRREAIIKLSRDITSASKKVIFYLHRLTSNLVKTIWMVSSKLSSTDEFFRYHRSISPGIQEFIEAKTYCEYLRTRTLVTKDEIEDYLQSFPQVPSETAPKFMLKITIEDYLGGVADLTGELMRHAINSLSNGPERGAQVTKEVIGFTRSLIFRCMLSFFLIPFFSKVSTMRSSLKKIEDAAYTIKIRGAEYADSPRYLTIFNDSIKIWLLQHPWIFENAFVLQTKCLDLQTFS
ncbi:Translin [Melampsora americana]|nr:Translin [Melampsora americana]